MQSLRNKIFLWLLPLAITILLFAYAYYKAREAVIIDHILQTTQLAASVGEGEVDHFLGLRRSEFELISSAMIACERGTSLPDLSQRALRYTNGFSALIISNPTGKVIHSELSSNKSNQHILRQDISGKPAFAEIDFLEVKHRFEEWKQHLPKLRRTEQALLAELKELTRRSEHNSRRYRAIQSQLYDMRDLLQAPHGVVALSGYELGKAAGLPFSNDTFLFSRPLQNCNNQLLGYYTAYLDRTQLEDLLYKIKQYLDERGLKKVDVALVDNHQNRLLSDSRYLTESTLKRLSTPLPNQPEIRNDLGGIVVSRTIPLSQELMTSAHIHGEEGQFHTLAEQVWADKAQGTSLLIFVSKQEVLALCNTLKREVAIWALVVLAIFILLVIMLSRYIVDPIVQLQARALALTHGDFDNLQPMSKRSDEIGMLSESFDRMAEAIQTKERVLIDMASHDPLTGCLNRRAFFAVAEEERQRAKRTGCKLSVCLLDLDHFKRINDHYGHNIGDEVLRRFTSGINDILRAEDKLSRIGGEEFAILLVGADIDTGRKIAERIRKKTEQIDIPGYDHNDLIITVSIGLSEWVIPEPFEQALSRADEKMYKAKRLGRNQVQC